MGIGVIVIIITTINEMVFFFCSFILSSEKRMQGLFHVALDAPSAEVPNDLGAGGQERFHFEASERGVEGEQDEVTALGSHDRPLKSAFLSNRKASASLFLVHVVHNPHESSFKQESLGIVISHLNNSISSLIGVTDAVQTGGR